MDIISELIRLLSFYAARTKIEGFVGEQASKDLAKLGHLFQICIDIAKQEQVAIATQEVAKENSAQVIENNHISNILDELNATQQVAPRIIRRRRRKVEDVTV